MIADQITKVFDFALAPGELFELVASPEGITQWFCNSIEGDFRVGQSVVLIWGQTRVRAKIVAIEPPSRFVYMWKPLPNTDDLIDETACTTVEFKVEPTQSGSRLSLTESGFVYLPAEWAEHAYIENHQGWDEELNELVDLVERRVTAGS